MVILVASSESNKKGFDYRVGNMNNLHVCGVVRRTDAEYSAIASFVVGTNGRLEEEDDGRTSPTATKMAIKSPAKKMAFFIFYLLTVGYVYVCMFQLPTVVVVV
jgi:hypothetical protein